MYRCGTILTNSVTSFLLLCFLLACHTVFIHIMLVLVFVGPCLQDSRDCSRRIGPNVTEEEANALFDMHAAEWELQNWKKFDGILNDLSTFFDGPFYHIGVVMLNGMRKPQKASRCNRGEDTRGPAQGRILPDELPENFKDRLLDVVITDSQDDMLGPEPSLAPFIRAGLLTQTGQFSKVSARWYYNHRCFPNRATRAPKSLDYLVELGSISAKRLRDTLINGFPKGSYFPASLQ
jgi:hypothetical protein